MSHVDCPELGTGILKTWNLNELGISPGRSVQGNRFVSSVAPEQSVWFTAATTSTTANDHGLVVNLDPKANRFRIWDLDTRLGTATGLGAIFLDQDAGFIWVGAGEATVHRLDPISRAQLTWSLPVNPINSVIRGIAARPDNSLMISLQDVQGHADSIRNLNPANDTLTTFFLPTADAAPFGAAVAPNGSFFFGEFNLNRIARLDVHAAANNLTEWQLPGDATPLDLFVDREGFVWFADQQRVGRLDPQQNRLALFAKDEFAPSAVAPIRRGYGTEFVAAAEDGNPFMDVVCSDRPSETTVPVHASSVSSITNSIQPSPSRPTLTLRELEPSAGTSEPVDPPSITRYPVETPTLAIAQHGRFLYATGVRFVTSTFRFYQLDVCELH